MLWETTPTNLTNQISMHLIFPTSILMKLSQCPWIVNFLNHRTQLKLATFKKISKVQLLIRTNKKFPIMNRQLIMFKSKQMKDLVRRILKHKIRCSVKRWKTSKIKKYVRRRSLSKMKSKNIRGMNLRFIKNQGLKVIINNHKIWTDLNKS